MGRTREYWIEKLKSKHMKICDETFKLLKSISKLPEDYQFYYPSTANYFVIKRVQPKTNKLTKNIIFFYPPLSESEELRIGFYNQNFNQWERTFSTVGIKVNNYDSGRVPKVQIFVTPAQFETHKELIKDLIQETTDGLMVSTN